MKLHLTYLPGQMQILPPSQRLPFTYKYYSFFWVPTAICITALAIVGGRMKAISDCLKKAYLISNGHV